VGYHATMNPVEGAVTPLGTGGSLDISSMSRQLEPSGLACSCTQPKKNCCTLLIAAGGLDSMGRNASPHLIPFRSVAVIST
jgi:hypothetical protein